MGGASEDFVNALKSKISDTKIHEQVKRNLLSDAFDVLWSAAVCAIIGRWCPVGDANGRDVSERDGLWTCKSYVEALAKQPRALQTHPDPDGVQLGELAFFLGKLCDELKPFGKKVAVFQDYGSLYQVERSEAETKLFKKGLQNVNIWYGHQSVQVWVATSGIPKTLAFSRRRVVLALAGARVLANGRSRCAC